MISIASAARVTLAHVALLLHVDLLLVENDEERVSNTCASLHPSEDCWQDISVMEINYFTNVVYIVLHQRVSARIMTRTVDCSVQPENNAIRKQDIIFQFTIPGKRSLSRHPIKKHFQGLSCCP